MVRSHEARRCEESLRSAPVRARLRRCCVSANTRFITMKRINARWTANASPTAELIRSAQPEVKLETTNTAAATMDTREA